MKQEKLPHIFKDFPGLNKQNSRTFRTAKNPGLSRMWQLATLYTHLGKFFSSKFSHIFELFSFPFQGELHCDDIREVVKYFQYVLFLLF